MPILPALLALALQTPAPAPAPAAQNVALADLVPKNTVVFVQAPTLERAARLVDRLAQTFAPGGAPKIDVATLLAMIELPGDASAVDATRPAGLCLVLDEIEGAEPVPAFLVPVRDAQAFLKSLSAAGSGMQGVAKGGYVCIGIGAAPELPPAPTAIARGLPEGELCARVDLGRLVEQFRPMISASLDQIQAQAASASAATHSAMDPAPVMAAYVGWLRDVVDSAETLDLALRLEGDELEVGLALANAEGSALAGFASKEKTELRALAGLLDLEAGVSVLMGMDPAALTKRFQPFLQAMPAAYPEALRPAMQYLVEHMAELYGLAGTAQAGSMDFTPSGLRYRAYSRGGDPLKLLESYRKLGELMPGLEFTDVPEREVAGVKVRGLRLKLDLPALFKLLSEKDAPEVPPETLDGMLQKFFGKDGLAIQVATRDGTSVMVIGGDDEYLGASIARISAKSAPPPSLARALQQVGDLNPCMIVRYDLGRMMGGMKELMESLMPGGAGPFPNFALSLTAWGGVDGRVWRGAFVLRLSEMAALARLGRSTSARPMRVVAQADITSITMALEEYAINNGGRYPDALEVLVVKDTNGVAYLETADGKLPKDPWGNEYRYEPGTQDHPQPRVISYGSDGAPGGAGEAADIDSDSLDQDK